MSSGSGDGFDLPIGLAFAPWGELFVISQTTGVLSRFTFDSSHSPVPNGTYQIQGPTVASMGGLGWILIVPDASTLSSGDGGVTDAGSTPDGAMADTASDAASSDRFAA